MQRNLCVCLSLQVTVSLLLFFALFINHCSVLRLSHRLLWWIDNDSSCSYYEESEKMHEEKDYQTLLYVYVARQSTYSLSCTSTSFLVASPQVNRQVYLVLVLHRRLEYTTGSKVQLPTCARRRTKRKPFQISTIICVNAPAMSNYHGSKARFRYLY